MTLTDRPVRLAFYVLAAVIAARLLSMAFLPLTDPTEGRYALVSHEIVQTGDWVTPRIWMAETHIPFLGKPPLFFWAAASSMHLLGATEFAARLPSALAAIALLALLYVVMERYGEKGLGALSVFVTASCGFFVALIGIVAVDMVFSACVAGSLLAYFAFSFESEPTVKKRWSLLVFLLLALAFMTKGPVALVLFGLPVLLWTIRWRDWRSLRAHAWLSGAALFLVITVPWFVLCDMRNPGFLTYFFVNENFLRFVTHDYGDLYGNGHLYPRGSAILMFLAATSPWCLLPVWQISRAKHRTQTAGIGSMRAEFLLYGFVTGVFFWCVARQLLFTYVLPMVPLFAAWLVLTTKSEPVRRRILFSATALQAAIALLCVASIPFLRTVKSTREIVAMTRQHAATNPGEPLVFERKTPYSAMYYAAGWVEPHPKEALALTLDRYRSQHASLLLVLEADRQKSLQTLVPGAWTELGRSGDWILGRVTLRSPAKVSRLAGDDDTETTSATGTKDAHSPGSVRQDRT